MAICSCCLPACCCQPAVVGGVILQISGVSLALTWPHRLSLLRVLLCGSLCYKLFPFQAHWGEVTLHLLSLVGLFIYSSHGKCVFPPLLWSFPPTATFTSFTVPGCWVWAAFSGPACLFTVPWGSSPSPFLWCSGHPTLFATFLCCCYCLLFSFFSLGGGRSVQGAMLIWSREMAMLIWSVCGSTACRLAHLVVYVFPSSPGAVVWWCSNPPGFSI
jgi:hypothetical protein